MKVSEKKQKEPCEDKNISLGTVNAWSERSLIFFGNLCFLILLNLPMNANFKKHRIDTGMTREVNSHWRPWVENYLFRNILLFILDFFMPLMQYLNFIKYFLQNKLLSWSLLKDDSFYKKIFYNRSTNSAAFC